MANQGTGNYAGGTMPAPRPPGWLPRWAADARPGKGELGLYLGGGGGQGLDHGEDGAVVMAMVVAVIVAVAMVVIVAMVVAVIVVMAVAGHQGLSLVAATIAHGGSSRKLPARAGR